MAWYVYAAYVVVAAGAYWYASSLDYPDPPNKAPSTVSPADTGVGFAPISQLPASELPVPVIYGKARLNGLIVHARPYGDNFSKCHYILLFGDKGYSVEQMYVDKYPIEDLPNYWENISGAIQDESNSWYNAYPLGGSVQLNLSNTGTFGVMQTIDEPPDTIVASTQVLLYGGGTIKCVSTHTWGTAASYQKWSWKLINLDDPTDIRESEIYEETFFETQYIEETKYTDAEYTAVPGSQTRSHLFSVPDTLSKWSLTLVVYYGEKVYNWDDYYAEHPGSAYSLICRLPEDLYFYGDEGGRITFHSFEVQDIGYNEILKYNATIVYAHLVKDDTLTSNQPILNAVVQKTDNGNPAQSLYEYLTDTSTGLGLRNVDYPSSMEMVSWCQTNEYYYNRAITTFYTDDTILKEMCVSGRIILYEENGSIKMRPDKAELVKYLVDDTEIIVGSLRIGINAKNAANRVEGQYTEPFYGHVVERIYAEDYVDIETTGKRETTLGLAGVTSQQQAHDLTHLALNHITKSKYWCSFDTGIETVQMFKIADVIEISSETNALINGKKWRVQKIIEGSLFTYNVYCAQYDDEIYDFPVFAPWYEEITELEPIYGWPGPEEGPAMIVNIVFDDIIFPDGCFLKTTISLSWLVPTERFDYAVLYYSHDNADWKYIGSTQAPGYTFDWPMRYGVVYIKLVSVYGKVNNDSMAPIVAQYITGDPLCLGDDYPGYGIGQYGMQPWGA